MTRASPGEAGLLITEEMVIEQFRDELSFIDRNGAMTLLEKYCDRFESFEGWYFTRRKLMDEIKRKFDMEVVGPSASHFPLTSTEEEGRRIFEALVKENFISEDSYLDCWLYFMGYVTRQPAKMMPVMWLKNVQLAQEMLRTIYDRQLANNQITVKELLDLAPQCFVKKDNHPLTLAKTKSELSSDHDLLMKILRPVPTPAETPVHT
jgi:hypothetical protein